MEKEEALFDDNEFRYVLVGNIIDKHYFGVEKEIRRGTKHFGPGTKVYLLPKFGGNGYMEMHVYGMHRKSKRNIVLVIRSYMIKNIRVKKTVAPKIIEKISECYFYRDVDNDAVVLQQFAESINNNNREFSVELD
jgi:hypothetical protein